MSGQRKIRIEYMQLRELKKLPRNAKLHDADAIEESFHRFGYVDPIVIDETSGCIVSGHGRLDKLAELFANKGEIPAGIQRDGPYWTAPVVRGVEFSDMAEAEAYAIAANRLTMLGGFDEKKLAETLQELSSNEALEGTGYDEESLIELLAGLEKNQAATLLHSSESSEWYTPPSIIDFIREVMGGIDLDPASCKEANKIVGAKEFYAEEQDGLSKPWPGRVFLNPPYGGSTHKWVEKQVADHVSGVSSQAMTLVNNVADRQWFKPFWRYPVLWLDNRIEFIPPKSRTKEVTGSPHGSVIVYMGDNVLRFATEAKKRELGVIVAPVESFKKYGLESCTHVSV